MRYALQVPEDELDLDRCLFSGQVFRWAKRVDTYEGVDGGTWFKIHRSDEFLDVESNALPDDLNNLLNLRVNSREVAEQIITRAPEMAPYIDALGGLRILQPSDPVEVFYSFLCTANNNLRRIVPMIAKLAAYGEPMAGTELRRFPGTEIIAAIPEVELRAQGFGYRGATIPHAAREVLGRGGDVWLAGLKEVGYQVAHDEMVSIKGIGHKLADCICLYGLHYGEAVPIDTHMWQAACRVFFPQHQGRALTELRYREVGDFFRDKFGDLAGWAHLFLYYENMLNWRKR